MFEIIRQKVLYRYIDITKSSAMHYSVTEEVVDRVESEPMAECLVDVYNKAIMNNHEDRIPPILYVRRINSPRKTHED